MTTTSLPDVEAVLDSDRAFWRGVLAAGGNTSIAGYHLTALTLMNRRSRRPARAGEPRSAPAPCPARTQR